MKLKKPTLAKLLLYILLSGIVGFVALVVTAVIILSPDNEPHFKRNEMKEYLEHRFPGKEFVLSKNFEEGGDKYDDGLIIWDVYFKSKPELVFQVISDRHWIGSGMGAKLVCDRYNTYDAVFANYYYRQYIQTSKSCVSIKLDSLYNCTDTYRHNNHSVSMKLDDLYNYTDTYRCDNYKNPYSMECPCNVEERAKSFLKKCYFYVAFNNRNELPVVVNEMKNFYLFLSKQSYPVQVNYNFYYATGESWIDMTSVISDSTYQLVQDRYAEWLMKHQPGNLGEFTKKELKQVAEKSECQFRLTTRDGVVSEAVTYDDLLLCSKPGYEEWISTEVLYQILKRNGFIVKGNDSCFEFTGCKENKYKFSKDFIDEKGKLYYLYNDEEMNVHADLRGIEFKGIINSSFLSYMAGMYFGNESDYKSR